MILKALDLREKSETELEEELTKLKAELFQTKMNFHARKTENHSAMREMKKSIARILTILKDKREAASQEGETNNA